MSRWIVGLMIAGLFAATDILRAQVPDREVEEEGTVERPIVLPAIAVELDVAERTKTTTVLTEHVMRGHFAMNMNDYLLMGVPGVSTARRSNFGFSGPNAGFFLRGLTGTRVAVFVDGIPVQVNSHFHPRSDQYSPDLVHHMRVVKGSSAVLHGASAVGGVIELFTRRPPEGVSGYLQAIGGELDTRIADGDIAYNWGGGHAWFGFTDRETDAQILEEAFDLRNLNLKARQEINAGWSLGYRYGNTEEEPSDVFGDDPEQVFFRFTEDLTTHVVSLDRQTQDSSTLLGYHFNELDTGSFRESIAAGITNQSERLEQERGVIAKHTLFRSGGDALTLGADWVEYSDENPKGSDEVEASFTSPFVHATQSIGERVRLESGLRFTTSDDYDNDLSPEAGILYELAEDVALRVRGGKAYRVPRAGEIFTPTPSEDLEPEDFVHAEVGLDASVRERATFDVAVWWMEGDNLIQTVGTGAARHSENTGDFSHKGVEATVNVHLNPYLSLLLGAAVTDLDEESIRFVPKKTFDFGADLHWQRLRATLIGRHAADNTTEVLDDYTVADLRTQYEIVEGLSLILDVVNITDEEYATFLVGESPIEQVPRTFLGGLRYGYRVR